MKIISIFINQEKITNKIKNIKDKNKEQVIASDFFK